MELSPALYDTAMALLFFIGVAVALNIVSWALLRCFRVFFLGKEAISNHDISSMYEEPGFENAYRWFGFDERKDFAHFLREKRESNNFQIEYEPFTEFRHSPFTSRHINISEHGFRQIENQGPWPPDPNNRNIFLFGGSHMFSWGTDSTTVASFLQQELRSHGQRAVCVYNFGRGSYFSTQEKTFFFKLLEQGHYPDHAIFFHGLNEFLRFKGTPITSHMYQEALRGHYASIRKTTTPWAEG